MKHIKENNEMSMHEVSVLYKRPIMDEMPVIKSSDSANDLIHFITEDISLDYKEHFWCFYLTNSNNVLCYSEIGIGNATGVIVNINEIFATAIAVSASAFIIFHNHPSGSIKPSVKDQELTNSLNVLGKMHGIKLLDHIIITSQKEFYSFADEGKLNEGDIPF